MEGRSRDQSSRERTYHERSLDARGRDGEINWPRCAAVRAYPIAGLGLGFGAAKTMANRVGAMEPNRKYRHSRRVATGLRTRSRLAGREPAQPRLAYQEW